MAELTKKQIASLLVPAKGRGPAKDVTEPRDVNTWFRLNHHIREERCENPNCIDPRPPTKEDGTPNKGSWIVGDVKGQQICRYCFLGGYLSDDPEFFGKWNKPQTQQAGGE